MRQNSESLREHKLTYTYYMRCIVTKLKVRSDFFDYTYSTYVEIDNTDPSFSLYSSKKKNFKIVAFFNFQIPCVRIGNFDINLFVL